MSVIASRYRSAFGKSVLSLFIVLLFFCPGCGEQEHTAIPDEEFQHIYGDILLLGELHRSDTATLRLSLDSLLDAHGIDTTALFAKARDVALDAERSAELYRVVIERFEQQSGRPDTTAVKTAPPLGFD